MTTKSTKIDKKFSATSPNFAVNVLNFLLSTLALSGVSLPAAPETITNDLVNTLSSTGWVAVVGLIVINVISPLYHAIKSKSFSIKGIFSSFNFWIQVGTLAAATIALVGIELPGGTSDQVVGAIYTKDWAALAVILFTNILTPLIRWLKDKVAVSSAA